MTFNRKYAICVKLSRIEFHLAVMKQNLFITNFHKWYFVTKIDLTYCEKKLF